MHTTYLLFLITGEIKDEAREACDTKWNGITKSLKRQTRVSEPEPHLATPPLPDLPRKHRDGPIKKAASRHILESAQLYSSRALWLSFLQPQHKATSLQ